MNVSEALVTKCPLSLKCGGYFINFYLDFIEVPSYRDVSDFMINDIGWTLEYY